MTLSRCWVQKDRRVRLSVIPHPGISDGAEGTLRGRHNNNNTFTWSGPSGVFGFTGQLRVAPLEHCALAKFTLAVPLNLPFVGWVPT
jgi:hypothetical protein